MNRMKALEIFSEVRMTLEKDAEQHVIFHCKNGKDRSAFGMLAFLQLMFQYTYGDAMAVLQVRKRADKYWPLVTMRHIESFWWDWLDDALNAQA